MIIIPVLVAMLLLGGCVTTEPKEPEESPLAIVPEFPLGKYVHDVAVDVPSHGNWQMRGVLRISESGIALLGLSPMGTTVFSIDDVYAENAPKIEVFQTELQPYTEKILGIYTQLRSHLSGRKGLSQAEVPANWAVKFYASKKKPPLPPTIEVHSDQFSLRVEVDQYEP